MSSSGDKPKVARRVPRRCNQLDGKAWLQNSISVWGDLRKSREELQLKHPALFPVMLVQRLIETFLSAEGRRILDPFAGVGSTLVGAALAGRVGVGLELSPEFAAVARRRLAELEAFREPISTQGSSGRPPPPVKPLKTRQPAEKSAAASPMSGAASAPGGYELHRASAQDRTGRETHATGVRGGGYELHEASALDLLKFVPAGSIDLCITSPPYWDILNQKRTADSKDTRHYGNLPQDLGTIDDYEDFLTALADVFRCVLAALKPGAYCCIVVMDLRKKDRFFPFHSDLATRLVEQGWLWDDLVIWNRQSEYNNLRPLGYPAVFRVNKVHEYILLMQKPKIATRNSAPARSKRAAPNSESTPK